MFKIRLCGQNSYQNNIDIDRANKDKEKAKQFPDGLSYFHSEMEVLLMPYFMFTVTAIIEPKEGSGDFTVIECQEIPYQD